LTDGKDGLIHSFGLAKRFLGGRAMKSVRAGCLLGLAVFTALVAAGGCGSGESGSEAKVPEDRRAPATEVSAGLKKIQGIAETTAAVTASGDRARAEDLNGEIEPQWQKIEGTIRANDKDTYLTFEDSFAVLEGAVKSGDAPMASKGAADVATSVQRYLAKFPG
jgi:hypothetical protein